MVRSRVPDEKALTTARPTERQSAWPVSNAAMGRLLRRSALDEQTSTDLPGQLSASGTHPIPEQSRVQLEDGLGLSLDHVRLHTDDSAASLAAQVHARAFTVGDDIYFGADQYAPATGEGYELLAHEVTHTLQDQGSASGIDDPRSPAEQQAQHVARQLSANQAVIGQLQQAGGNAATARFVRRAVMPGSGSRMPDIEGRADYERLAAEYHALKVGDQITPEAAKDGDAASLTGSEAISAVEITYWRNQSSGGTAASVALGGVAIAGVLAADDVTGVGVFDDPLIIPALAIAGTAAAIAGIQRARASNDLAAAVDSARTALRQVITTLTEILIAAKVGEQIRSNTTQLAIHLARILGSEVGGMPPDHQNDPERDREHWWREVLNFVKEVRKHELSPKQLWRELSKKFTREQIEAIIAAIKKAAEMLGKDPPDFPPVAFP